MFKLLRHFSLTSAIAILAVTVVLVILYRQNAMDDLVDIAERQNVALARSFANTIWPQFSPYVGAVPGLDGDALRARPETRQIHEALMTLTTGLPVLKVKIYNLDGLTVFSSQASQIGEDKSNNRGFFAAAREGRPESKLVHKEKFSAFSGEVVNRDLVESYLPIRRGDGPVEGVFELYSDVTPLIGEIERSTRSLVSGFLLIFGVLYGALFLIVRRADRILKSQYATLKCEVTERKRVEEALRESRARLIDAIESISEGFVLFDAEERLVLCNSKYREFYPMIADVLKPGGHLEDIVRAAAERGQIIQAIGDVDGWIRERLIQYRSARGTQEQHLSDGRWLVASERRTRDGGIVGVRTDITERKRAQEARKRLALAIDGLSEHVVLFNSDDRIVLANAAWRKLNKDIIETTVPGTRFEDHLRAGIKAGLLPEAVGREEEWLRWRMEHHRNPKGAFEVERQDGRWILINEQRLPDGGTILIISDITERKRAEAALRGSEQRFRNLVDGSVQGILIHQDRRPVYVNRAWAEIHGCTVDEALAMDSVIPLIAPSEHARMAEYRKLRMEGGEAPSWYEYEAVRKDGSHIWLENMVTVVTWKDERAIQSTIVDITERKSAEAQLRQAQKMEAVGQLTGGVAHDFNNLLAVILGNLQLIERRLGDDERQRKRVETAIHATLRGADLIKRLLAFSRRQVLEPKNVDLNELVSGTTELWRRTLGERIEIDLRLSGDLEPTHIDPGQLENALLNLAVNARDAMPGGGRLTIETATIDVDERYAAGHPGMSSGRYVLLTVADTGTGMSSDVLKHVFEPFYTTKEVGKGTGLGLSMVYGFAKQSGAYVDIRSEEGRGTAVDLYLPTTESADGAAPEQAATTDGCPGGGETILVVEDEADVRETAVALLEGMGYRVLEAENGPAALAMLDGRDDIDLLFIDVVMPGGMNGFELGREARQRRRGIAMLYASGYVWETMDGHERLDGDDHVIGKPYQNEELARWVRNALDGCAQ